MANCDVRNMRRGPWLEEEDERLTTIVGTLGEKHWDVLAKQSGLRRSGKSCRLRWLNYLRPNLKHGEITHEEEHTILSLHKQWGNKWSKIAKRLPGRTDNEIKNYWRSHLKKKSEAQQECCDYMVGESSMSIEKEDIFGRSSSETFEACNMNALGNDSPYESRMLDWISSCCWSGDDAVKHDEDCMGTCPCFCLLGSRFEEEEKKQCVWDLWNPIWEMG